MNATETEQKWEKISRHVSLGLVAVVLLGTAYIFYRVGDEERRLTIAVKQGVEGVALKEIAQNFSRYKHISVEVAELPYDKLYEEEQRQLKNRPLHQRDAIPPFDVIMVDDPWLYSFVYGPDPDNNKPRLENLNSVLKKETADDFFPKTLEVAKYCPIDSSYGDYFAIPFVANSQLFAYRAADSGKSSSTWKRVCDRSLKAKSGSVGYVTRIGPGNSIVTDFMPILWALDHYSLPQRQSPRPSPPPLFNPDAAFKTLKTLVGKHRNLGSASFDDFDVSAYLQKGCASTGIVWSAWAMMLVDTDSAASELIKKSDPNATQGERDAKLQALLLCQASDVKQSNAAHDSSTPFKERLVFGPVPSGRGAASAPELGVWLLAIPAESDQRDLAREFIEYATDLRPRPGAKPTEQSLVAAQRGTPPPRKSVLDDLERAAKYKDDHPSLIPQIRLSLNNARPRPRTPCWRRIESLLGKYLERVVEEPTKSRGLADDAKSELAPLFDEQGCTLYRKSTDEK